MVPRCPELQLADRFPHAGSRHAQRLGQIPLRRQAITRHHLLPCDELGKALITCSLRPCWGSGFNPATRFFLSFNAILFGNRSDQFEEKETGDNLSSLTLSNAVFCDFYDQPRPEMLCLALVVPALDVRSQRVFSPHLGLNFIRLTRLSQAFAGSGRDHQPPTSLQLQRIEY